ncbi:hypothetical protein [Desulfonatronum lacustre]|uniref:hypothetical protein n=1 Tax=Desulfonatronum lacustre TaxID=66849 RepID=UPI00048EB78B|nr:hypothetical protein [Desulfonatronum lacustre]SMP80356.1 hypothetical protein SAMN06295888_13411 [Desulfonatronum zhilinae]
MNEIKMTEPINRAVAWIDETRREHPDRPLASLLAEAGMRFNLGPSDGRFLERFFQTEAPSEGRGESESP